MPKLSDEKYQAIVEDYLSGMTQKSVGEKHGVKDEAVGKIVRRLGHQTRSYTGERTNAKRKWEWNYSYFYGNSPEVAYWGGFLMADGSINVNGKMQTMIIVVGQKDLQHLYCLMDSIGLSRDALYTRKEGHVGFNIQHPFLEDSLKRWGVVPRKTYNFREPDVPDELLPHFLRGWCDGDGMVYSYGTGARVCIAGSPPSLEWYKGKLQQLGYAGTITVQKTRSPYGKLLYAGGANNVERMRKLLLVDESFKLERRWNITYNNKHNYIYRNCEVCGNEFGVTKLRAENEPTNGRFCSKDCFHEHQRELQTLISN